MAQEQLKSEINTPAMETAVLKAARKVLRVNNLNAMFEHGHWWVEHCMTGWLWSVEDAEGPDTHEGFGFEVITRGENW